MKIAGLAEIRLNQSWLDDDKESESVSDGMKSMPKEQIEKQPRIVIDKPRIGHRTTDQKVE